MNLCNIAKICFDSLNIRVLVILMLFSVNCLAENLVTSQPGVVFPLLAPKLSSGFGPRNHPIKRAVRHHHGVDLAAPEKSHVRSILSGIVIFAGDLNGYGKVVTVKHGDDNISLYGHLSSINVIVGQTVNSGAVIGRVGSTGMVTGPHLHFEWRKGRRSINPLKVFPDLATEPVG
jgi:murein DD-endopeptidase MepM/ murein hydrolase activator NlpD